MAKTKAMKTFSVTLQVEAKNGTSIKTKTFWQNATTGTDVRIKQVQCNEMQPPTPQPAETELD